MVKFTTREDWLKEAFKILTPRFDSLADVPKKVHILTSWPHGTKKAIGQCFSSSWAEDKVQYICISPILGEDPSRVLDVLIHEMIHTTGIMKHGKDFKKIAHKLGLTGPMKATEATPELTESLKEVTKALGTYPHSVMTEPIKPKKAKGKKQILKFTSPVEPTYSCWITPAQAEQVGPPICPISKKLMVEA